MEKLNKEKCLILGKAFIEKNKCYPVSTKWNITTAGCSRDRIYENWPSWADFIKDLKNIIEVPEINKKQSLILKDARPTISYNLEDLIETYCIKYNIPISIKITNAVITKRRNIKELQLEFPNKPKDKPYWSYILDDLNKKFCSKCRRAYFI